MFIDVLTLLLSLDKRLSEKQPFGEVCASFLNSFHGRLMLPTLDVELALIFLRIRELSYYILIFHKFYVYYSSFQ